ncbi:MAG: transposase [Saprospirales bacterium]|nr:transposase [Saprospirales bacterium]
MEGYVEIEKYKALEAQVESLKFQLEQMKRMIFGAKSERYIAEVAEEQLSLFDVPSASSSQEEKVRVPAHDRKKTKTKKHPVRLVLPEHLKREETVIEPRVLTWPIWFVSGKNVRRPCIIHRPNS